ncbi:MAG: YbaK/EbsC family protein [Rhizobiaceae bacterium]|nr:YbaK/EbsC family protein [Rhizobiaceae bacterium]
MMLAALPETVARVVADAASKGFRLDVVETRSAARSVEDAARAIGTIPARIVKSLVFRGRNSGAACLVLASGSGRVDEEALAQHLGEAAMRPDADFVRATTGFVIGGVSPFGSIQPLATFMDESLFDHPTVWAAAGSPRHVFEAVPLQLRSATLARIVKIG